MKYFQTAKLNTNKKEKTQFVLFYRNLASFLSTFNKIFTMKKINLLFCLFFVYMAASAQMAQPKVNPVIKSYGAVYQLPNAAHHPDPKINYKIIVELTENASKPD